VTDGVGYDFSLVRKTRLAQTLKEVFAIGWLSVPFGSRPG
jgi:hypothetical protein